MLPIRTVLEDVTAVCGYLVKKPTGATTVEARQVLDSRYLDARKLSALKTWGLIEEHGDRLKPTPDGRDLARDASQFRRVMMSVVRRTPAYGAVVERVAHRREESITATEVAAHWHAHFQADAGDSDKTLNDQAVCFFQVASGAGLGEIVVGRRGSPTRFEFNQQALVDYIDEFAADGTVAEVNDAVIAEVTTDGSRPGQTTPAPERRSADLGQGIFIAHGKNRKTLEQLKHILNEFKIPYKVATEEPNLGRPIGTKVREVMQACNCAILIFTADEEFQDKDGNQIWRPSENVVFELGAAGYLYEHRIVIMKEDSVTFPSNFKDLGHISFSKDALDAKTMDVLKELIGFGIVRVST